jgi:hypothetical protein
MKGGGAYIGLQYLDVARIKGCNKVRVMLVSGESRYSPTIFSSFSSTFFSSASAA